MSYEIRLLNEEGSAVVLVGHFEGKVPAALKKLNGKAAPDPDQLPDSEPGQKLATAIRDKSVLGPLYVEII